MGYTSFEQKWPSIQPVIQKLLEQQAVTQKEWQELFSSIHAVCLWDEKGATKIRDALQEDIDRFIERVKEEVHRHKEELTLLKAYISEWRKFFTQCDILPTPFIQLERALLNKNPINSHNYGNHKKEISADDSVVRKIMLESWNKYIFEDIKQRLQDTAMKLVQAERNGESFDSQLVIGVRESYVNLCPNSANKLEFYKSNFEAAYIETTKAFYVLKVDEHLQTNGVLAYMDYAYLKLVDEENRARKYLEPGKDSNGVESVDKLKRCCEEVLIQGPHSVIIAECPKLISSGQTKHLQLMFRLLDRITDGVNQMLDDLEKHIVDAGIADMKAAAETINQDSEKYVERLIGLYRKFTDLIKDAFNSDPRFYTSRDKAYKRVVDDTTIFKLELMSSITCRGTKGTQGESRCPDLLANFCDLLLKKSSYSKRLTPEQIENKLKDILLVLKYVENKDVFMRKYQIYLTRRLILENSADSEKEEEMVEWLREGGMPSEYVSKLGRMFQDIKVSRDLNHDFKQKTQLHDAINIKILNAGAWSRNGERITVSLPIELEDYIPEVEEFYKKTHSGRKLQWYHHMSNGTITFVNSVGRFDLDVTTLQMAVLFAWNQRPKDKVSYENLKLATELPDFELRRTLWSLVSCPKNKEQILLYEPTVTNPKDFTEHSQFWINQEFVIVKNRKTQKRGKLNLIGRLQNSSEKSQTEDNESIYQLRVYRTQEAIIKILKMRKRITNSALQVELIDVLKNMFFPNKKMVKEQLEYLIENKFMRRDEDDINIFIYMS